MRSKRNNLYEQNKNQTLKKLFKHFIFQGSSNSGSIPSLTYTTMARHWMFFLYPEFTLTFSLPWARVSALTYSALSPQEVNPTYHHLGNILHAHFGVHHSLAQSHPAHLTHLTLTAIPWSLKMPCTKVSISLFSFISTLRPKVDYWSFPKTCFAFLLLICSACYSFCKKCPP